MMFAVVRLSTTNFLISIIRIYDTWAISNYIQIKLALLCRTAPIPVKTKDAVERPPPTFQLPSRAPQAQENPFSGPEFVALARIFSGSVQIGQRLFVLGPKFDGSKVSFTASFNTLVHVIASPQLEVVTVVNLIRNTKRSE